MNKVSRIIATSYDLTVTASEEASRFGVRDIDIEHVLLALVLGAGLVLAGLLVAAAMLWRGPAVPRSRVRAGAQRHAGP